VSLAGVVISAALDIPTGATIVCVFGLTLVAAWIVVAWKRLATGWTKRFSVTKVFER
jgi:ABC-type Mn2+/Zn2+ transport system permease subunit